MSGRYRLSGVNEAMFKLIIVGNAGTGKSCLLLRYTKDQFDQAYHATIGVEFATKKLDIDENYRIKLQFWDTAGQENFLSIVKSFYRNSSAIILVYDITKRKTFEALKNWIEQARENAPSTAMYVLIGTHLDLESQREIAKEQAEQWMKQQNIAFFFETSAKTAENVSKAFDQIGKQLFMNKLEKRRESFSPTKIQAHANGNKFTLNEEKKEDKSCC